MSFKILSLDWFEVVVQAAVTMLFGVMADSFLHGPVADVLIGTVVTGSLAVLAIRRRRALSGATRVEDYDRVARLEDRVAQLELEQGRMLELEERLDFAERLLVQTRDPARLPDGGA